MEHCNGHFKGVWRHVLAIWTKALTLYYCTNCTTTFSSTLFCVHATKQENSSRILLRLQRCSVGLGMDFKLVLHRKTTKSGKRSLVKDQASTTTLWCAGNFTTSLSHLYIKEWRLRVFVMLNERLTTFLQVPNLCWNCSAFT